MTERQARRIVVAGAGIAGLTAAIAFARRGFSVQVFEQAPRFEPFGAGLQLSPNASRILDGLGVLAALRPKAVQPQAVLLRDAASLKTLAHIPLGDFAERRWGAPYLAVHRADLHAALVHSARQEKTIDLVTDARITGDAAAAGNGATVTVEGNGRREIVEADFVIGADGVWSALRGNLFPASRRRFSGSLAWRATVTADSPAGQAFSAVSAADCVTTFLDPAFHLVAYPVSGGSAFNLVAFTKGPADGKSSAAAISVLRQAMRHAPPALAHVVEEAGAWTAWPIHTVDQDGSWTRGGRFALIGDAAHAMTPFAAQGAAMAIEDAATLAQAVAGTHGEPTEALGAWERKRKARMTKVAQRGALNKLAWNAAGPLAIGRDLLLRMRSPESLAADLDWLYGWRIANSE
ncbi:MAG: FAD-dependent monooxygenase [Mesorhizobium sp.]|nr:FAD-dependent monooxygenase [Mesorhizobium sp.]MBN9241488.1 FAD-dependent monooxygenase [Mesorhizobium sp.]